MIAEFKAQVKHASKEHGESSYPTNGQVVCWSDCPDIPSTWRVGTIKVQGGIISSPTYAAGTSPMPGSFFWFVIPQFVLLVKLKEDAGL